MSWKVFQIIAFLKLCYLLLSEITSIRLFQQLMKKLWAIISQKWITSFEDFSSAMVLISLFSFLVFVFFLNQFTSLWFDRCRDILIIYHEWEFSSIIFEKWVRYTFYSFAFHKKISAHITIYHLRLISLSVDLNVFK